jgi:mono/diheme cytochrome c family protein
MFSAARFRNFICALAVAAAFVPGSGFAANVDNGSRLAHRWCQACHVVSPTQSRPSTDAAPPFAEIAARSDFDAGKIALFLLDPHPKMPDMSLTRSEAADLAAYIGSLAKRK